MMIHVISAVCLAVLLPAAMPRIIFPDSVASPDRCQLPPESGMCRGFFEMFFYNSRTGHCETLIYGGCGGNSNLFGTRQECEQACVTSQESSVEDVFQEPSDAIVFPGDNGVRSHVSEICNLPAAPGVCRAYFPSYFYNSNTRTCEYFVYGGCDGNANRFDSEVECRRFCMPGY